MTLITRPRRFGKTLNMSMLEKFFSVTYAGREEFKVQEEEEPELYDTVQDALRQIEEKDYQAALVARGIPQERIRKYGFAFCGKKVLIDSAPANRTGN